MPHITTGDQNPKAQKIRMRQPCEVGGEQHLRKRLACAGVSRQEGNGPVAGAEDGPAWWFEVRKGEQER